MSLEKKDGAVEKLMKEGTKQIESSGDKYDELKLDVPEHNTEKAYAGMGKEELMKYANSPFWVRLRWLLFVIFWMSWFAMMFGALFIIFMTPKCKTTSKLEWYQKSPVYIINASSLLKNSSLDGIHEKIQYMEKLGIQNVVLTSVLFTDEDGVIDFNQTNNILGNISKVNNLITKLKENGTMKVMLKLVPIHSSKTNIFFIRSFKNESIYKDYYIWNSGFNSKTPINNWLNVDGESAWKWHETRKEFYFHQFSAGKPDFNFRSKDVVKYFEDIFKYWLKQGFDGLYLDQVQFLFKVENFTNEEAYSYTNKSNLLNHTKITYLPETYELLSKWGELINNNCGILIASNFDSKDMLKKVNMVHSSVSLPYEFDAEQLRDAINNKTTSSSWPSWEWVCSDTSKSWKTETIDAFNILSSLVGGTPFINVDSKVFQNDSIQNITLIESTLKELRSLPTAELSFGKSKVLNKTILYFDRKMSDSESIIFAWNLSKKVFILNLNSSKEIPDEVNLSLCTQSACSILPPLESKVKKDNISLAAESAVVLKF